MRQNGMILDRGARLRPKWMSPQSSLACRATDRVELSVKRSHYVRASHPMTGLRPLEETQVKGGIK